MSPPEGGTPAPRIKALEAAATALELEEPELVATAAAECVARAERELRDGMPRGKAYVLGLRDLTVGRPPLGVAVARSLGLEHIVEDLLEGASVDGVTGIGPDGEILAPSPSDRRRRRGTVLVLLGGIVLLVGATAADSLSLVWVIVWTIGSFALIFGGLRDVLHRSVPRRGRPTTRPVDGEPSAHGADARAAHRPEVDDDVPVGVAQALFGVGDLLLRAVAARTRSLARRRLALGMVGTDGARSGCRDHRTGRW